MNEPLCLFCHMNPVPVARWNMRCETCREEQKKKDEEEILQTSIHSRPPAAIIHPDSEPTSEVFVDKFGRETTNPGYDLKQDPRGWGHTGNKPPSRTIIK